MVYTIRPPRHSCRYYIITGREIYRVITEAASLPAPPPHVPNAIRGCGRPWDPLLTDAHIYIYINMQGKSRPGVGSYRFLRIRMPGPWAVYGCVLRIYTFTLGGMGCADTIHNISGMANDPCKI